MITPNRPVIVGLAGGTASGKTTQAKQLAELLADLRVRLIHMDRYFLRVKPHMPGPITGQDFEDHNHPASFDLEGLVADLDACCAADEADVVIVEGLMTLHHEPLRQRLDLRLYVDAPADERIVRRLRRNMAVGHAFDDIARFYLQSVRFRHEEFVEPSRWHADLVLNGAYPSDRGLELVAQWVRARVGDRAHADGQG